MPLQEAGRAATSLLFVAASSRERLRTRGLFVFHGSADRPKMLPLLKYEKG